MQKLKRFAILLLFLFMLPIAIGQLPFPNNKATTEQPEQKLIAYAAAPVKEATADALATPFKVLLLFTHSHEAYKPVVQMKSGTKAVYDDQTNIFAMQELIGHYMQLNGLQSTVLDQDVMTIMKEKGATFHQAYDVVRPLLAKELNEKQYDLVLDIHRDSAPSTVTTIEVEGQKFAKIAFVVGAEHGGYQSNFAYAEALSEKLNSITPGISRGVIKKQGEGVNGVYNQDLSPTMLLVELGGIDNSEEELQRTLSVLAQAIAKTFVSEQF